MKYAKHKQYRALHMVGDDGFCRCQSPKQKREHNADHWETFADEKEAEPHFMYLCNRCVLRSAKKQAYDPVAYRAARETERINGLADRLTYHSQKFGGDADSDAWKSKRITEAQQDHLKHFGKKARETNDWTRGRAAIEIDRLIREKAPPNPERGCNDF